MKKIISFTGSNTANSTNRTLVQIAGSLVDKHEVEFVDLRDYPAPILSLDIEADTGIPEAMKALKKKLDTADAFIFSSPEHNGSTPAFLKNTLDWLSRIDMKYFGNKPVLALSTSPGQGGGARNLASMVALLPWAGANITGSYSLGNFFDKVKEGQLEEESLKELKAEVQKLEEALVS